MAEEKEKKGGFKFDIDEQEGKEMSHQMATDDLDSGVKINDDEEWLDEKYDHGHKPNEEMEESSKIAEVKNQMEKDEADSAKENGSSDTK